MQQADAPSRALTVSGISVELYQHGSGPPLLFLHPHTGIDARAPFLRELARNWTVTAPSHPGFGRTDLPRWLTTVDDLSYFYLDLLETLDLRDVTLVGASFGAWIAAQIAVKSTERLARLVLAGPVGIKVSAPETADIFDIFVASPKEVGQRLYHDPSLANVDLTGKSEDEALVVFRNRESTALFAWSPYMNDPRLKHWLRRIRIPTLVLRGEHDGMVSADYAGAFAGLIPGASFEQIEKSAHFPHLEQPDRFVESVVRFAKKSESLAA